MIKNWLFWDYRHIYCFFSDSDQFLQKKWLFKQQYLWHKQTFGLVYIDHFWSSRYNFQTTKNLYIHFNKIFMKADPIPMTPYHYNKYPDMTHCDKWAILKCQPQCGSWNSEIWKCEYQKYREAFLGTIKRVVH